MIYMEKEYSDINLQTHPHYMDIDESFEVHHKIPQGYLAQHPDWFSHRQIHDVENLVGIPRNTGVHDSINHEWTKFWRDFPDATKQVLHKVKDIDARIGAEYLP
jgi:hypothetical protein